jgi:hypothetical protein
MRHLSLAVALILTLAFVGHAEARSSEDKKNFYKGWIELGCGC